VKADDTTRQDFRRALARQLRIDSVRVSSLAGSGHPTSSMSSADLMAALLDGHLRLDYQRPGEPHNDHLIFSKGHASPLYYSMLRAVGAITEDEFRTYRTLGSRLEGHPTPRIPPTDVATGSLGQGLPIGVGIALAGRYLDRLPYRVWVLCGDSELAEGSIWEAFEHAAHYDLANLTAIVDVNRLGQTRETMVGRDLDTHAARARAFGWHAIILDGHDPDAIEAAMTEAEHTTDRPTVLLARTVKGHGVAAVADQEGKHGKPLDDPEAAIAELGGRRADLTVRVATPDVTPEPNLFTASSGSLPRWRVGDEVATRQAYGEALAALGTLRPDLVAMDGEVSNSTHSDLFAKAHPDRYFEMYIAEQQLVAAAVGVQVRGWTPFASTFAAFFSRAYDFVRMAAISRANLRLCGSHAGVSIGADGPSQMALEDMAAMRAVHGSTVLHPSDANQTARLVADMADQPGISYLRTLRGPTVVRTPPEEDVRIGGSRVVRSSAEDQVTVVACGVTVDEAVAAADVLGRQGIEARVVDCYSIKPIDAAALRAAAQDTHAIVTVEDHWPEGGMGDAVLAALAGFDDPVVVRTLAVREMPTSGTPEELRAAAGIDADAIARAAGEILAERRLTVG
jgi:transketolase